MKMRCFCPRKMRAEWAYLRYNQLSKKENGKETQMLFWIYMLFIDSLIPLTMIGFGAYFRKNPPKDINASFGYRTKRSMKSQDAWQYAHEHCGKIWYLLGLIILLLSFASMIVLYCFLNRDTTTVGAYGSIICGVQLLTLIVSVFPTEFALKKRFDQNK